MVFSQELAFPVDFTNKPTHKWHFVLKGTWSVRSEAPLCGVSEFSAHISSVLAHHSWVWVIKPKIGSVFHPGRLSCKITDELGLSKQAAVTAA